MVMVEAVVRPEKADEVLLGLQEEGFAAATRLSVLGRGKQKGLKVKDLLYDELPKELIMLVVEDEEEDKVVSIIMQKGKTSNEGTFGDGKIFVTNVSKVYTVSSGKEEL